MRIASLSPATTEILFAIGAGADIVCRDQFSNWPDETSSINKLMGHDRIDPAALRAFGPEVVFTETVVQEKLAALLRAERFGVVHQDPRTLAQIYAGIRATGTIVGKEPEAEALIVKIQQGFNMVQKKSRLLPRQPRVYVEEWPSFAPPDGGATAGRPSFTSTDGGATAGRSSAFVSGNWVPEVVRIAGGKPYPLKDGELSKTVTLDDVVSFDPDLIVISWCGAGNLADKDLLLKRPGWGAVRAVQEGNVRVIDDALLNRPGPRLVEGAGYLYGWMFELLH